MYVCASVGRRLHWTVAGSASVHLIYYSENVHFLVALFLFVISNFETKLNKMQPTWSFSGFVFPYLYGIFIERKWESKRNVFPVEFPYLMWRLLIFVSFRLLYIQIFTKQKKVTKTHNKKYYSLRHLIVTDSFRMHFFYFFSTVFTNMFLNCMGNKAKKW